MSFQEAYKNLGNNLKDASKLTIRTFSGDLKATIMAGAGNDDFAALFKAAAKAGTIELKLLTEMSLDKDVDHFEATVVDPVLRQAHAAAFEAGHKARQAIIDLIVRAGEKALKAI